MTSCEENHPAQLWLLDVLAVTSVTCARSPG
jgi:hypothetical protein